MHGQKIADSPFRSDPVNPIHESELARIIQEQSQRKTKIATLAEIRRGPEALKAFVERSKQECSYLIFDGETQDDLKIIAAAVHQEKIFLGGSGLAEELAIYWAEHAPQPRTFETLGTRTMILAGSLTPQTHKQIQLFEQTPQSCSVVLDPLALFDKQTALRQAEQAKARMKAALDKDLIPLVYFQNDAALVRQTKDRGPAMRLDGNTDCAGTLVKIGRSGSRCDSGQLRFPGSVRGRRYFCTIYRTHEDKYDGNCRRAGTRTVLHLCLQRLRPLAFYSEIGQLWF